MCAQAHRADVVARVAEYLRFEGLPEVRFEVKIRTQSVQITIVCEEWPEPTNPPKTREANAGREFSPTEKKILDGLRGRGWVTAPELGEAIGEEVTNDFRAILRNLQDREYVEINNRFGVRLL